MGIYLDEMILAESGSFRSNTKEEDAQCIASWEKQSMDKLKEQYAEALNQEDADEIFCLKKAMPNKCETEEAKKDITKWMARAKTAQNAENDKTWAEHEEREDKRRAKEARAKKKAGK